MNNKVIVVLGPTAAGKTKIAVDLAKKFNGEIISADSRQVYRGLDAGTSKDLSEYGDVPYHLIDVAEPMENFTLANYQKMAYEKIDDILVRKKTPIVCGGTGLYIDALVKGYELSFIESNNKNFREDLEKLTLEELLKKLKEVDPETFEVIDQKNRRRVQRAVEIFLETGIPKSKHSKANKPSYEFLQIGITFDKEVLNTKIVQRLQYGLDEEGMIEEVKSLHKQGVTWQRFEDLGLEYRFIARHLQDELTYNEMIEQLQTAIQQFAKRQMTWFKRDKDIHWINNYNEAEALVNKFL